MYAEFSLVSLLSMSNSELFLVKDEEEGMEFGILKRPALEFQEECTQARVSSHEEREVDEEKKGECSVKNSSESEKRKPCLGEFKATDDDDDDDGFKTPTSLDHKIPVIKQCPPAPRKPKPPLASSKRKAPSSPSTRRVLQLDLSREIESLFPRPLLADLHRRVKKARREDRQ